MLDAIQQKVQSLELMKIFLHVTLAGIFFKRGLLPLVTFGERSISLHATSSRRGPHVRTYDEFTSGETSQDNGPKFQAKVMERGVDSQTDRILDLLEGSIFEVLVRRRLQAIKFTIVKSMDQPIEIIETYTISLAYHDERNNADRNVSTNTVIPNARKEAKDTSMAAIRTPLDIIRGIQQMDRLLIPLTATSIKLPSTRTLGIFLLYTDDCPEGYQAPDFIDVQDFVFKFTREEDQVMRNLICGGINTGLHSARLKVTYLNPVATSCRSSEAQLSPRSVAARGDMTEPTLMILEEDDSSRDTVLKPNSSG